MPVDFSETQKPGQVLSPYVLRTPCSIKSLADLVTFRLGIIMVLRYKFSTVAALHRHSVCFSSPTVVSTRVYGLVA